MLAKPDFTASRETKILIEMMIERSTDETPIITWQEATAATGMDRETVRGPIASATKHMLNQYGKVWLNDRGIGYRLAKDGDIARNMEGERKKSYRIARRAIKRAACADVTNMTGTEKVQFILNRTVMEMYKSVSSPRALTCVEQMAVRKHNQWSMDELLDGIRQSLKK